MTTTPWELERLKPWLEVRFDRSSGPGGQHVNKLSTRVALLFDFETCPLLSAAQRALLRTRLARRLSQDGRLRIVAQSERSQLANRTAAEERLLALLERALHVEKPRRPTRPTAGSHRRRLHEKKTRGQTKARRRAGADED